MNETPEAPVEAAVESVEKESKPEKTEVRFESAMPIEEAISYFEAIINGLKKGTLTLKQDEKQLTLEPPQHLGVEVRAARKKDKERISFEIAWRSNQSSDLTITSD